MMFTTGLVKMAAAIAVCVGALPGQAIQLRDGSILVGEISAPDDDGFTLFRTDNGGVLELRWDHLTESSSTLIRTALGLHNTEQDEVRVTAEVFLYRNAIGTINEVQGIEIGRDETEFRVRNRGTVYRIKRANLQGLTKRQVTPFEIYTRQEYYNMLLGEYAPGEDADKHLALGDMLTRVRAYEFAGTHLEKAKSLGGGRQPRLLEEKIAYLKRRQGAAEEVDSLDGIRVATNRGDFKKVEAMLEEFVQRFPESKLKADFERLKKRFEKQRDEKLIHRVTRQWYKQIGAIATRQVGDGGLSLREAQAYATRGMSEEIVDRVAELLEIPAEEVRGYWNRRFDVRTASASQSFTYAVGSWVLGERAILEGTKKGDEEAAATSDSDEELQRGIRRIQEARRRAREALQRQRRSQVEKLTPESWWEDAAPSVRRTFLKALYAERSGDLQIGRPFVRPCLNCAGSGRDAAGSITGNQTRECPVCHGTRFKRSFTAK